MHSVDEDIYVIKQPLKCLVIAPNCTTSSCQQILECQNSDFSKHCYAMTQYNSKTLKNDVLYAGCWSGGENDCSPPLELLTHIDKKIQTEGNHDLEYINRLRNFNLSDQLRDPIIQDKCIGYTKSAKDLTFLARHNQTFCCCSGTACNKKLAFVTEQNPFQVFASTMNPKVPNFFENNSNKNGSAIGFISPRDLTMVAMSGLVCLLIISSILCLFYCLRRNSKKKKDSPYLSSVYYSRANSINDLQHSNSGKKNTLMSVIRF